MYSPNYDFCPGIYRLFFSKLKQQRRDSQNVLKPLLHLLKLLHQLSKINGDTVNGQLVRLAVKNTGRLKRQRKERKDVKRGTLDSRKTNHDVVLLLFLLLRCTKFFS